MPEQIRAQRSLVTVVHAACRAAGLPEEIVQSSGDGVLIMPPSDIDETAVIPDLVRGLTTALRQENRLLSEAARIRLRLALTNGVIAAGPTGFSGPAIIECFRLLDSPVVKAVLVDFPAAELAMVVSDHLYQDVIRHGFRDLDADDFWKVRSTIQDRGFSATAWVWVSNRTGGEPAPSTDQAEGGGEVAEARSLADQGRFRDAVRTLDGVTPSGVTERMALLDVRADCLIALGDLEDAIRDLEELLRIGPGAPPSALFRLGRSQLGLGDTQAARQTFKKLIDHTPREPRAYLELGRLERLAGRNAAAKDYLATGAELLDDGGLLATLTRELLELPLPGTASP
ncbi:tetratricopeptide repeat protein [Nonomuraea typhae]|uniref:tetratricopeptide repeat protein n=1 Tax=Nonomuraea typhae TaxID=2603600 RepID=UPI0015E20676|nr:tetratricopeptide repeat protein [Nonomuraea typhae]